MTFRTGFFSLAFLSLASCLALPGKAPDVMVWPNGPNSVSLLAGEVVLDAPDGYCLEAEEADRKDTAQSLFFAACGPGYPHVVMSAVVSAGVTPGILDQTGAQALAAYFASARGHETLSRTGKASSVTLHSTEIGDGVVVLHLSDTSSSLKAGLTPMYWRAVAELNGHLVTFAVLPFSDATLPEETARALLDQFVEASQTLSQPEAEREDQ
jgi:hypothetical protein